MDRKTEFVGSISTKPVFYELIKKCSGGLAAVSSGVLLFAVQGERPDGFAVQLMLSLHAFSIPCLLSGSVFSTILSVFERMSLRMNALLERLYTVGFLASMGGYFLLVWMFDRWLFWALSSGMVFAIYQIREMTKEIDSPHMKSAG